MLNPGQNPLQISLALEARLALLAKGWGTAGLFHMTRWRTQAVFVNPRGCSFSPFLTAISHLRLLSPLTPIRLQGPPRKKQENNDRPSPPASPPQLLCLLRKGGGKEGAAFLPASPHSPSAVNRSLPPPLPHFQ